jgi:taurine dioxygenase
MTHAPRSSGSVRIEPIGPVLGAEITGFDFTAIEDEAFAGVERALADHQVLFFRDAPVLSPATQIDFARRLGELHAHPAAPHLDEHPEIFVIHAHRESRIANGNGWHTDVSCDLEPPAATCLQLHTLPASGGDTLFASAVAAFESLSTPLQAFLSGLTARHESEHVYRGRYADRGVDDRGRSYPSSVHPVVRTHPHTGRQALYVNPGFTTRIDGLTAAESAAMLAMLHAHQQRPEFQIRFRWSANAIALWDNRSTQHFALWDYWPNERRGHRVTIRGERPYFDGRLPQHRPDLRLSSQRLAATY